VIRANRFRATVLAIGMVALGAFAVAGIVAGEPAWGALLLLIAIAGLASTIYLLRAPPLLVVTARGVEIRGVVLRWNEMSDVYISHERGNWFSSRPRLIFRRSGTSGFLTVPLWLGDVPWERALEQVERCSGRAVTDWEARLNEAGQSSSTS
jgi:hypothetical protein